MSARPSSNASPPPLLHTCTSPIYISTFSGSKAAPEYPAAVSSLPQFASFPNAAVLHKGDFAIVRAIRWASSSVLAPFTRIVNSFVAPSPSPASILASVTQTSSSALRNKRKPSVPSCISSLPASPDAISSALSHTLVSPSTDILLKDLPAAATRAALRAPMDMRASVVIIDIIVAKSGCIMPEPLAIPPMRTCFPPISQLACACFAVVSVVIIARTASVPPSRERFAFFTPASILSKGNGTPITPVEAVSTSSGAHPNSWAASFAISKASCRPRSARHALALPAFIITSCALPFARFSCASCRECPLTMFRVNSPAAFAKTSHLTMARSLSPFFFIPHATPAAIKPFGYVTPLISSIDHAFPYPMTYRE